MSYHVGIYLAEGSSAKYVLEQLLLRIGPHPEEKVEPCLQQVYSSFRQSLLGVPDGHWKSVALHIQLVLHRERRWMPTLIYVTVIIIK